MVNKILKKLHQIDILQKDLHKQRILENTHIIQRIVKPRHS